MATPPRVADAPAPDADPHEIAETRSDRRPSPDLLIRVSQGAGTGPTRMAAFDAALHAAGVADYNLLRLSSVIPPSAVVQQVQGGEQVKGGTGDILYCVYAAAYASNPGEQAWAGLAWATRADGSGGGVFVELTASSETLLRRDLHATIVAMSHTRHDTLQYAGMTMSSAVCIDHPVCAVTLAAYRAVGWGGTRGHQQPGPHALPGGART